jgi:uncharacterized protein
MASKPQRSQEIDLNQAVLAGRVAEVSRLLKAGVNPNAFDDKSRNFKLAFTALCNAINAAAHTTSKVRAGIDEVNRALFPATAPADLKAERENSLEIIRLLLSAGADPNLRTFSRTPLSLAANFGDKEVVQVLLDAGANPSGECWSPFSKLRRPKGGLAFYCNALHIAAEKGFTDVARLLLAHGAEVSARDHSGMTALQVARQRHNSEVVDILEQHEQTFPK